MAIIAKRVPPSVDEDEEAASEAQPPTSKVILSTEAGDITVSYTHLTLPTICSV